MRNGFANTELLPSYTTVNVAAAKNFDLGAGFGKLDARIALVNLFDRVYQLRDGSGIGGRGIYPAMVFGGWCPIASSGGGGG